MQEEIHKNCMRPSLVPAPVLRLIVRDARGDRSCGAKLGCMQLLRISPCIRCKYTFFYERAQIGQRRTKFKEQTKIVMYTGQRSNLGATAFLLIHRRFHCLWRQTSNVGGSSKFSLCSSANAQ